MPNLLSGVYSRGLAPFITHARKMRTMLSQQRYRSPGRMMFEAAYAKALAKLAALADKTPEEAERAYLAAA